MSLKYKNYEKITFEDALMSYYGPNDNVIFYGYLDEYDLRILQYFMNDFQEYIHNKTVNIAWIKTLKKGSYISRKNFDRLIEFKVDVHIAKEIREDEYSSEEPLAPDDDFY